MGKREAGNRRTNGVSAVGEMTNEARRLMFRDKLEGKGGACLYRQSSAGDRVGRSNTNGSVD
jgi:hypothetical protein